MIHVVARILLLVGLVSTAAFAVTRHGSRVAEHRFDARWALTAAAVEGVLILLAIDWSAP